MANLVNIYSLTPEEAAAITTVNSQRTNVLLIICSYPNVDYGVILEDLQKEEFSEYLQALGGQINEEQIVEIDLDEMELF